MYASNKVKNMPEYVFSAFQKKKKELQEKGVDVIDLGIGAPDLPTPSFIYNSLVEEAKDPQNHRYSNYNGSDEFRQAVAEFYKNHFNVDLDPEKEILTLIGSKEGIVHLIQAVINEGDKVLIPNPGYPTYKMGVHLAGGESVNLPLDDNDFVPRFDMLSEEDKDNAKLMFLNYPSNPTTATVEIDTFMEAVSFAGENNIIFAHDSAYNLVTFDKYKSPSALQVPNAKECTVEFGSLSKSFNMTGWRIGYIAGNEQVIKALATLKSNLDTSQFLPIQKAAATALRSDFSSVEENNSIFKSRMEKLHQALNKLGIYSEKPRGTIFLWARVPKGYTSLSFANKLLDEAGIIVTPGTAFGSRGEGYFRISLSVTEERLDEVIHRLTLLNIVR
ncbi:aminotransferase class I/II-fold pyridoxal phosphate-dependent enzyme [Oceanobacillus bengalensis]|uniref:Aminotransferase n=1 Tax=Oceanobacillus bengalensis TaxID=1435466 RepID=A0A494YWN5_9BACI|nr:aminotransferase class I/II-fold pyridoxal phosphate-dependent enzyme [Oceanobacillus bengalensis]RKQ14621.1 aminotransferase class I/II-fold pyridoxal phosphate-dependent enzyme [Oceanobacillus bengalensis]